MIQLKNNIIVKKCIICFAKDIVKPFCNMNNIAEGEGVLVVTNSYSKKQLARRFLEQESGYAIEELDIFNDRDCLYVINSLNLLLTYNVHFINSESYNDLIQIICDNNIKYIITDWTNEELGLDGINTLNKPIL